MATRPLQHYLRTHRRRAGFSQKELAHLLGCASETKVSRYEMLKSRPSVITVFAYEIIFNQPVRELFAGTYESVRHDVQSRATELISRLNTESPDPQTTRKLDLLRSIVDSKSSPSEHR